MRIRGQSKRDSAILQLAQSVGLSATHCSTEPDCYWLYGGPIGSEEFHSKARFVSYKELRQLIKARQS